MIGSTHTPGICLRKSTRKPIIKRLRLVFYRQVRKLRSLQTRRGGPRDGASAAAAGQDAGRVAGGADRPCGRAGADLPAAAAADAFFEVDRVGDQAIRAQRAALAVAGGRLACCPASRAGDGAGAGTAVPADPQPVPLPAQRDHALAAGAGGTPDPRGAGLAESVDEPQHHREWRFRAVPGEQPGLVMQKPRQFLQVSLLGDGRLDRCGDRFGRQAGVGHRDDPGKHQERIAGVPVRALAAARPALPVAERDLPRVPAARALLRDPGG